VVKCFKSVFLFLCLVFYTASLQSFALSIPEKPKGHINDYANLFSTEASQLLEERLINFEKETSNQIVIVTFKSLEDESLEDFSIKLAQKWKIGTKEHDNGVIILIFKKEHKIRIEVGYGLEGILPDALCDRIIRHEIVPYFKTGNFSQGIINGIDVVISAIKGEYKADEKYAKKEFLHKGISNLIPLIFILCIVIPVFLYVFVIVLAIYFCGFPLGIILGLIIVSLLEFMRRVRRGETLTGGGSVWFDDGFFKGGFGGGGFSGGGGSFGGGGASGRW